MPFPLVGAAVGSVLRELVVKGSVAVGSAVGSHILLDSIKDNSNLDSFDSPAIPKKTDDIIKVREDDLILDSTTQKLSSKTLSPAKVFESSDSATPYNPGVNFDDIMPRRIDPVIPSDLPKDNLLNIFSKQTEIMQNSLIFNQYQSGLFQAFINTFKDIAKANHELLSKILDNMAVLSSSHLKSTEIAEKNLTQSIRREHINNDIPPAYPVPPKPLPKPNEDLVASHQKLATSIDNLQKFMQKSILNPSVPIPGLKLKASQPIPLSVPEGLSVPLTVPKEPIPLDIPATVLEPISKPLNDIVAPLTSTGEFFSDRLAYETKSIDVKDMDGHTLTKATPRELTNIKNASIAKNATDENNFKLSEEDINFAFLDFIPDFSKILNQKTTVDILKEMKQEGYL